MIWGGARSPREVGKHVGQHYQRLHKRAESLYAVDARKIVGEDASADWLPCSVLLFAIVAGRAVNDKCTLDFNYYYSYVCTIKGAIATVLILFFL